MINVALFIVLVLWPKGYLKGIRTYFRTREELNRMKRFNITCRIY